MLASWCVQGQPGLSATDLFQRHPKLHEFLLGQLIEAAAQLDAGSGGAAAAADVHPSLLPVLALLSRLG